MTSSDGGIGDGAAALRAVSRRVLDEAWREPGFCVPHPTVYPHQWLWDSCFHAIAWADLGVADRAATELAHALGVVDRPVAASASPGGFVPHMRYWNDPGAATDFWGTPGRSCITQPPMFGHAVRRLLELGVPLDDAVLEAAAAGFRFLLRRRSRLDDGRVAVVHPWETGCDDSPRWDDGRGSFDVAAWRTTKAELVRRVELDADGVPVSSTWRRGSIGFNALLVWNVREFALATGSTEFDAEVAEVARAIAGRWSPDLGTWTDHDGPGGAVRTADTCLALFVDDRPEVRAALADPRRLGGPFGPAGVDRAEPIHDPDRYWRGPVWPQLGYLLTLAAEVCGDHELAASLARGTIAGVERSGFSEYWHPDLGEARGATPQTWATIAVALLDRA